MLLSIEVPPMIVYVNVFEKKKRYLTFLMKEIVSRKT